MREIQVWEGICVPLELGRSAERSLTELRDKPWRGTAHLADKLISYSLQLSHQPLLWGVEKLITGWSLESKDKALLKWLDFPTDLHLVDFLRFNIQYEGNTQLRSYMLLCACYIRTVHNNILISGNSLAPSPVWASVTPFCTDRH